MRNRLFCSASIVFSSWEREKIKRLLVFYWKIYILSCFLVNTDYTFSMYLILAPADIYYLTWVTLYEGGEVLILVDSTQYTAQNEETIFCDSRTSGLFDSTRFTIVEDREEWGNIFRQYEILFTDPDYLTQTLRDMIEWYGVKLTMKESPIAAQRIIKNSEEIQILRESQAINKAVYEAIQPFLTVGISEEAVARKIQILQLELWASGPSFPPIVAFWENTAVPHHSPTNRTLQSADIILIDMGVIFKWYCSDMTRCIVPEKV